MTLLRAVAVCTATTAVFYQYWIAPAVDRMTPWEGALPGSCTTAPTVRPAGWAGLANDAGRAVRSLAEGPPTPVEMVGWFETAGREAKTVKVAFDAGVGGRQLLPLASTPQGPMLEVGLQVGANQASSSGLAAWVTQPGMTWDPVKAAAVALAESGGNPQAINTQPTSNGRAHGLFQTLLPLHADRFAGGDWADPMLNARVAHELYLESGWAPWAASAAQHDRYEAQARDLLGGATVQTVAACEPEGGEARAVSGDLIEFGKQLQAEGVRVAEHPDFGGVASVHQGRGHYEGRAFDINTRPGTSELEQRELAPIVARARAAGFTVLFLVPGHFGHAHIEARAVEQTA